MPETMDGVMNKQSCFGCSTLEGLLDHPGGHVAFRVAGQKQWITQVGRFAHFLLPQDVWVGSKLNGKKPESQIGVQENCWEFVYLSTLNLELKGLILLKSSEKL